MKHTLVTASCLLTFLFANMAAAQTYSCKRSALSSSGFKTIAFAERIYPKTVDMLVTATEIGVKGYGMTPLTKKANKLEGSFKFDAPGFVMRFAFFPKTSRYTMVLVTSGRFESNAGARGKCVKVK